MNNQEEIYREKWWSRIQQTRRKYSFERARNGNDSGSASLFKILVWLKEDIVYVVRWTLNVFIQTRKYGADIKKNYNVSYSQQFFRMMNLAFVVRVNPRNFRKYRLFKQKNWENVRDFTFAHADVQREFSKELFPGEVDLFLNKFLFSEFCKKHEFPSPNIFAVYQNGECIFSENPADKLPKEDLFIKKMDGMMGIGAKKLVYKNGLYVDRDGGSFTEESLIDLLKETSLKKYPVLLQGVIKNHSSWCGFTSGALATCRIVTWRLPDSSEIKPLFATFRMPLGNSDVDNFSAGGVAAPVNLESGTLGKIVGSMPVNGLYEFTHHPETKQRVEGTVIPEWDGILKLAINLHKNVRSAFIGWDISLTEQGLCVLEGSLEWGVTTYEAPFEEPIKNTIYPVLFEKWMETGSGNHE